MLEASMYVVYTLTRALVGCVARERFLFAKQESQDLEKIIIIRLPYLCQQSVYLT